LCLFVSNFWMHPWKSAIQIFHIFEWCNLKKNSANKQVINESAMLLGLVILSNESVATVLSMPFLRANGQYSRTNVTVMHADDILCDWATKKIKIWWSAKNRKIILTIFSQLTVNRVKPILQGTQFLCSAVTAVQIDTFISFWQTDSRSDLWLGGTWQWEALYSLYENSLDNLINY